MEYDFDRIVDRSGTASMKWQKYEKTDVLPMWVADMDFKTPPEIIQALKKRMSHEIFGYTLVPDKLSRIVADRMKKLYGWHVEPEWIIWLPGVVSGLNMACRAFGKKIVTTTPIYPPFLSAPGNQNKEIITVPMKNENQRDTFDFNGIETAFRQGGGLFLLCSPYNPGGTLFNREELERLVSLCEEYNVILCSDEIHADFVLDPENSHIPTASISSGAADRTITLMAPSKTYNIPGLCASFAIVSDPDIREHFSKAGRGMMPAVNLLGLTAAQAAYEKCDEWLAQLITYLRSSRDLVVDRVNRMPGCSLNPIESTYLAWIDVRDTGLPDPAAFFEQAGVGLSDGRYFGRKGFVRLNFGCPRSVLEEGLKRMETALKTRVSD